MANEDIGALIVKIEADLRDFKSKMNDAVDILNKTQKKSVGLGSTIKNSLTFVGSFAIFNAIKAGFESSVKAGFKFNATMQQNKIAFEAMTGSAKVTERLLGRLSEMAAKTPFEFPDLATAAKRMIAFGFEANKIPDIMKNIGDAASGLGLGAEGISRITIALGQMQAKSKVSAEELLQLTEAGVPALDILAKAFGKTTAEISEMQAKGLIPAEEAIDALIQGMGERFPNMMEKQSKSFEGLMSTLRDNIQITFGTILQPAFDNLTNNILPVAILKLSEFTEIVGREGIGSAVESLAANFSELSATLAGVGVSITALKIISIVKALTDAWKVSTIAMTFAQGGLNAVLLANPIGLVIAALGALVAAITYSTLQSKKAINELKQELISVAEAEAEQAIDLASKRYDARTTKLSDELSAEQNAYSERIELLDNEYNEKVKYGEKSNKSAKKQLQEQRSLLDKNHNDAIQRIRDEYGVFEKNQKSKTDIIRETTEIAIKALDDELDKEKEAHELALDFIKEEYGDFKETHKSKIDIINEEYSNQKDLIKEILDLSEDAATQEGDTYSKTYDVILEKARDIHDEKVAMYQEEYLNSISLVNQDLAEKVKAFKKEINELESRTKEENALEKEKRNQEKILRLQAAVENAKDVDEREKANQDLSKEINRQNLVKEQENRKIQIESLQDQISEAVKTANQQKQDALTVLQSKIDEETPILEKKKNDEIARVIEERKSKEAEELLKFEATKTRIDSEKSEINTKASEEIAKIQEERIAKETAENLKYEATKTSLDNQLEAMSEYVNTYSEKLQEELEEKKRIEDEKLQAVKDRIEDEINENEELKQDEIDRANAIKDAKIEVAEDTAKEIIKSTPTKKPYTDIYTDVLPTQEGADYYFGTYPEFAKGVKNFAGGAAIVGEKGPELVNLAKGSNVMPANKTRELMNQSINYDGLFNGATINIRSDNDIKMIAREIFNLQQSKARGSGVAYG